MAKSDDGNYSASDSEESQPPTKKQNRPRKSSRKESDSEESQPPPKKQKLSSKAARQQHGSMYQLMVSDPTHCQNDQCQKALGRTSQKGPGGSRLCSPCGRRYRTALKVADENNEDIDDGWKNPAAEGSGSNSVSSSNAQSAPSASVAGASNSARPSRATSSKAGSSKAGASKAGASKAGASKAGRSNVSKTAADDRDSSPEPNAKLCANDLCRKPILSKGRTGPDGKVLCYSCHGRWVKAHKAAQDEDRSTDDDEWKTVNKPQKRVVQQGTCVECGGQKSVPHVHPNGSGRVCWNCWSSVKAKDSSKESKLTCKVCGTHDSDDWQDDLCKVCCQRRDVYSRLQQAPPSRIRNADIPREPTLSFTAIRDLAITNFRQLHPNHDPSLVDLQPSVTPHDYHHLNQATLRATARDRGISGSKVRDGQIWDLIRFLQMADALDGLLPRPSPEGASKYHGMDWLALTHLASRRGYFRQTSVQGQNATKEQLIEFLCDQDKNDPSAYLFQNVDPDTLALILLLELSDSLKFQQQDAGNQQQQRYQSTHNGRLTGSQVALQSLQRTFMYDLWPGHASSEGFLCGPSSLAQSWNAMLGVMRSEDPTRPAPEHDDQELMHRMMELLFRNYQRGVPPRDSEGQVVQGQPTPQYTAYLERHFGHLLREDAGVYQDEMEAHLHLNNVDVVQLAAILELAHESQLGGIPENFGLGVVRGAHIDPSTGQDLPAHARIVRPSPDNSPVLWVHNNIAIGGSQWNHFEPMVLGGRTETALEWGIRTTFSGGVAGRLYHSTTNPSAHQSETDRLRREIKTLQSELSLRMKKIRKGCLLCMEKDDLECGGEPGTVCDGCKNNQSDICIYPWAELPVPWKKGSELTADDLKSWEVPLHDEEEKLRMIAACKPTDKPEGPHFLCIGSARLSSGADLFGNVRILANLLRSVHRYDNLLAGPRFNNVADGRRPGYPNAQLPMQRFLMGLDGRWGGKPVPSARGNLLDPYLLAFIDLWDEIMDPGNTNPPQEIHILTLGIAGLGVPITAFGDFTSGFLGSIVRRDLVNNTDIHSRIYLVPVVEHRVVDGTPGSVHPGQPLPGWLTDGTKRFRKVRLIDLVRRHLRNEQTRLHNNLNPNHPVAPPPPTPVEQELDDYLKAMKDEFDWRSAHLDDNTVPTSGDVHGRNDRRNGEWR